MQSLFPRKLRPGDGVRVIAPSCSMRSMPWLNATAKKRVAARMEELGLHVSFSKNIGENDLLESSSVASRISDLHDAFRDPSVHLIHCVRGGFNSIELHRSLDFDLIRKNPKILCGFSDITSLATAIHVKTGLVTYSGPNYNNLSPTKGFEYTLEYFRRCLCTEDPIAVEPSRHWSNDHRMNASEKWKWSVNDGYWIMHKGSAKGTLLGGNLCTFNMLQGTEFFPDLRGSVLFIEDDFEAQPHHFNAHLQSLILQPGFSGVTGLVIGRFEKASGITRTILQHIIETKPALRKLPIIANADFGHTQPMITFPIGGRVKIGAEKRESLVEIIEH